MDQRQCAHCGADLKPSDLVIHFLNNHPDSQLSLAAAFKCKHMNYEGITGTRSELAKGPMAVTAHFDIMSVECTEDLNTLKTLGSDKYHLTIQENQMKRFLEMAFPNLTIVPNETSSNPSAHSDTEDANALEAENYALKIEPEPVNCTDTDVNEEVYEDANQIGEKALDELEHCTISEVQTFAHDVMDNANISSAIIENQQQETVVDLSLPTSRALEFPQVSPLRPSQRAKKSASSRPPQYMDWGSAVMYDISLQEARKQEEMRAKELEAMKMGYMQPFNPSRYGLTVQVSDIAANGLKKRFTFPSANPMPIPPPIMPLNGASQPIRARVPYKPRRRSAWTNHPFKCDECDYTCIQKRQLVSHKRVHTGDLLKCNLCRFVTSDDAYYRLHLRKHQTHPFWCDDCHRSFTNQRDLSIHSLKHLDKKAEGKPIPKRGRPPRVFKLRGQRSASQSAEQNEVNSEKPFEESTSSTPVNSIQENGVASAPSTPSSSAPVTWHTPVTSSPPVSSNDSPATAEQLVSTSTLLTPNDRVVDVTPSEIDMKVFAHSPPVASADASPIEFPSASPNLILPTRTTASIQSHTTTQMLTPPVMQPQQAPPLVHRRELRRGPQQIAYNRLMYKCDRCPFTTVWKWNLKQHAKRHSREHRISCDLCEYKCIRPCSLQNHIRIHHTNQRLMCAQCGFTCITNSALAKHKYETKHNYNSISNHQVMF